MSELHVKNRFGATNISTNNGKLIEYLGGTVSIKASRMFDRQPHLPPYCPRKAGFTGTSMLLVKMGSSASHRVSGSGRTPLSK